MCNPALAMMAVTAASTAISISNQNKAAAAAAESAKSAAVSDYEQLSEQSLQSGTKNSLQNLARSRQALKERGRLRVAMGAAGVQGNSPMREMANSFEQEAFDKGINNTNTTNALAQNLAQGKAVYANEQSRMNQAKSNVISPLQGALMIGASAMSGYAAGAGMGTAIAGGQAGHVTASGAGNNSSFTNSLFNTSDYYNNGQIWLNKDYQLTNNGELLYQ